MSIEAMKEALDAIETYGFDYMHGMPKKHYTKLLRKAIEEAEKSVHNSDMSEKHVHKTDKNEHEWVGLTDKEIDEAVKSCNTTDTYKYFRAIEAKLKEKNT